MSPKRLSRYVETDSETLAQNSRWLIGEGRLYAADRSKKWDGAVLFVDPFSKGTAIYRIYEISVEDFMKVWAGENGLSVMPDKHALLDRLFDVSVSGTVRADVAEKYDTAYVVHSFSERPVLTITTSKPLEPGSIAGAYRDTVLEGSTKPPSPGVSWTVTCRTCKPT